MDVPLDLEEEWEREMAQMAERSMPTIQVGSSQPPATPMRSAMPAPTLQSKNQPPPQNKGALSETDVLSMALM